MFFVEEGKGFHYINNDIVRISRGDIFIIPIGVEHVLRPSDENNQLVIYNVLFTIDYVQDVFKEISKFQDETLVEWLSSNILLRNDNYLHLQDKKVQCLNVVRAMFLERQKKNIGFGLMLDAKLKELFILLSRLDTRDEKDTMLAGGFTKDIEIVISYVNENYNESITIADMAKLAHVSERHFSRIFKNYMNQSFTKYLQTIRIEKSCELLENTNLSITEICLQIGYKNADFLEKYF
ncbi:two-component response regulator [Gracilibacillus boraciitolerans JCM 21714]|uniref:Two-component response regulator n=2 Tax=Gracilibacillus boraciitolerans TaxID=307521 RepID=W4VQC4_9BACI|nr:two-component response regulator [Gracilibacillus boraciitolerans JCM 21714]